MAAAADSITQKTPLWVSAVPFHPTIRDDMDWKTMPPRSPATTDCHAIMDALFKDRRHEKTKSYTFAYRMFQSIWLRSQHKFTVIGGIHQNHSRDVLHFSVKVEIAEGWYNTLHFNGYWRNEFQLTDINASTRRRDGEYDMETIWVAEEQAAAVEDVL